MTNVVILNGVIKALDPDRTRYLAHAAAQLTVETRPNLARKLPRRPRTLRQQITDSVEVHQVLCLNALADLARAQSSAGNYVTVRGELHYIRDETSQTNTKWPVIIASQMSIVTP
jgi:hypothetical protein